ncbi:MAG: HAMP domain-containing protein [Gemmatimonadetes bacterium]|nr:HAMP domain-containing protein [Gemmatimonadota bacterium]MYE71243.1 HAMP domain-containing protein [Gemmatimonadota bacterium]MYJ69831.1 HAMP domain-containing protein [Gemmatimonadota bacterium]
MTDSRKTLDHRLHSAFEWILPRLPSRVGDRIREATGGRFGIGTQIVLGLGGGVLLTVVSIVLALILMSIVSNRQTQVAEEYMPALVGAVDVARSSADLGRATPGLLAAVTPDDLDNVRLQVEETQNLLKIAVDEVSAALAMGRAEAGRGQEVVPLADSLATIVGEIYQSVFTRMNHQRNLETLDARLGAVGRTVDGELEGEIDDQYYFMRTGLRELTDSPVPESQRRTVAELDHKDGLSEFKAAWNYATALIAQAMTENDVQGLRATRERVDAAFTDISDALDAIRRRPRDRLQGFVSELRDLYSAPDGVFATRTAELQQVAAADSLVARGNRVTTELVNQVQTLTGGVEADAQQAADRSNTLVQVGVWFLLTVTVLTITLGVVAWKFFGERLLVRMGHLSDATRRMSKGDLEVQVQIEGNDEFTDMAGALEVFRQHAVEVQRLNLVEKLADEVQSKNDELEDTLENLRRTQQQVVKQEKLASLGALTAGIAHEIRNPLNFVNNFAMLSTELIEELREELAGGEDGNGEPDKEFIEEILDDLNTNVVKVNEHGRRANSIVEGMLAHSRDDSGESEAVDINAMVDEYARLAYHGMRGVDSTFNVDMIKEFDPNAGEVEAIARDLSRVFLNVVTNACQATHVRRQKEEDPSYLPTVRVKTEADERKVRVTIRDNGTGIPDEVLGKIFDPFFTTKTGTGGTGLGLSISHEIIEEHGGKLEVDTKPGEFTEFVITLPRKSHLATGVA